MIRGMPQMHAECCSLCHVINRPMHMLMLLSLSSRWHNIWDGGLQKGQVLQAAAFEAKSPALPVASWRAPCWLRRRHRGAHPVHLLSPCRSLMPLRHPQPCSTSWTLANQM